jgi:hypothetical protein
VSERAKGGEDENEMADGIKKRESQEEISQMIRREIKI